MLFNSDADPIYVNADPKDPQANSYSKPKNHRIINERIENYGAYIVFISK